MFVLFTLRTKEVFWLVILFSDQTAKSESGFSMNDDEYGNTLSTLLHMKNAHYLGFVAWKVKLVLKCVALVPTPSDKHG